MTQRVNELSIIRFRFTGDTSSLIKASANAKAQLGKLSTEFRSGATDAAKWGAATAAAAAAAGIAIYSSVSAATKELKNFSAVADVSTEAMQKMVFGAKSLDIGIDKLSDILKDVNDRVGDFSEAGGGPMVDFFDNIAPKVGLTIEKFKTLSGQEALQAYYDALEQANLGQKEMTFYLEAMASDTTALIPLLKNGGKGFADAASEAEKLGVVLSEIDVLKITEANSEISKSAQVIEGVAKRVTARMAPIVSGFSGMFLDAARESDGFASVVDGAFDAIVAGAGFGMDAVEGVRRTFVIAGQAAATFALAIQRDSISIAKAILDLPVDAVNTLIEGLNSLPYVNLEVVSPGQFSKAMEREINLAAEAVEAGKQAMNETLMAPLPSEAFKQFVEEAQAASQEAAEALAATGMIGLGGSGGEDVESGGADQAKLKEKLEALMEANASELEIAREKFGEEQVILEDALAAKLLTEDEYRAASLDAENNYRESQLSITKDAEDRKTAIEGAAAAARKAALGNALSNLTGLMNTESKKQFKIGQAAAIAQTVISTYEGAQKAFTSFAGLGPWGVAAGVVAAGAAIAAGGARVSAIRSQSVGGSSAPTNTPTQQVNASSTPVSGGGGGGESAGNQQSVALNIDPDAIITGRGIISMLEEAQKNGANLSFLGAT